MTADLEVVNRPGRTLEELLVEMQRFGKPSLVMLDRGWLCSVSMNTNTTGTSFDVKSDYGMPDPFRAALQCRERIDAALNQLAVGPTREAPK